MSVMYGNKLKISIFGQSHSEEIGVIIDGLPAGIKIDREFLKSFMSRRAPGQAFSTPRKEADEIEFVSGLNERDETCGTSICAVIKNTNVKSSDYSNLEKCPRPSHSDLTAYFKYGEKRDVRGGGQFSGRLTAPMCIAGGIALSLLKQKGINIGAHILKIGNIVDERYSFVDENINENQSDFPVINKAVAELMKEKIIETSKLLDSIGGEIECKITGMPVAIGGPLFDGVENNLAKIMFAIPGVKGFEIGAGFSVSDKTGSQNNDLLTVKNGKIVTITNNDGGINGGITNGMPIVFKIALKPTPSIGKPQQTINLETLKEEIIEIKGRHDPCIAVRAVPVVEACSAIAILDMMLEGDNQWT